MELVHANTNDPSGGRFCGARNWSGLVTDGFDGMTCPDCIAEIAEIIVAIMGDDG